jgi:sarcosine oxidase subunit alpha
MPDLRVNGRLVNVPDGVSVAAAILIAGVTTFRRSVTGQPRGPLCGMGICFECRATIDGVPHQRTCQLPAQSGMEIQTDAPR